MVLHEKMIIFLAAEIYAKAPQGFRSISQYIDNLSYEEEPNYILIQVFTFRLQGDS